MRWPSLSPVLLEHVPHILQRVLDGSLVLGRTMARFQAQVESRVKAGRAPVLDEEDQRILDLAEAFRRANELNRNEVARVAATLWKALQEQFEGISNFLAADVAEQDR